MSLTMEQQLAALKAENAALKAKQAKKANPKISYKVAEKSKALSIYGLGRFPVTLHLSQAERLIADIPNMQQFINEHRSEFAVKEQSEQVAV